MNNKSMGCYKFATCMFLTGAFNWTVSFALPQGFVYLEDKHIICNINYSTKDNFVGQKIDGYVEKKCIVTKETAAALILVQRELDSLNSGYRTRIYDAYRPTDAVKHFVRWSKESNKKHTKNKYYPSFEKEELFPEYISLRSGHSRGSTVDLTICIYSDGKCEDLEMGTIFDFFGEESHTDYGNISIKAKENRNLLKNIMEKNGFKNYEKEWWHYTLVNEPFRDEYFNFYVS